MGFPTVTHPSPCNHPIQWPLKALSLKLSGMKSSPPWFPRHHTLLSLPGRMLSCLLPNAGVPRPSPSALGISGCTQYRSPWGLGRKGGNYYKEGRALSPGPWPGLWKGLEREPQGLHVSHLDVFAQLFSLSRLFSVTWQNEAAPNFKFSCCE